MSDKPSAHVYAVTLHASAEMVVWVEADNAPDAKLAALKGEYEVMTDWTPRDYSKVKAVRVGRSKWPPDAPGRDS